MGMGKCLFWLEMGGVILVGSKEGYQVWGMIRDYWTRFGMQFVYVTTVFQRKKLMWIGFVDSFSQMTSVILGKWAAKRLRIF